MKPTLIKIFAVLFCTVTLSQTTFAQATFGQSPSGAGSEPYIKLGEAKARKSLLAFPPLLYFGTPTTSSQYLKVGGDLFNVILNDLTVSSYFQMIDQKAYLENPSKTSLRPAPGDPKGFNFRSWKAINSDFLIRGGFSIIGSDVELEIYAYSVVRSDLVVGKKYRGPISSLRKIAHTFSNDLILALTGQTSMFNSKIVVASDKGGGKFREIYIMDWDAADPQKITNHQTVSISPNWSPDGSKVLYTAFVKRKNAGRNPDMYVYNTGAGDRYRVSYRNGTNSGGFFTPDGKDILLTVSQKGNPDIYRIGLDGEVKQQITKGPLGAMNVEPVMSPDGKKIAFSSDRHGRPMIYTMNPDGSDVKRITFAGEFNSSPAWSPDGKKIAFAGQEKSHFDVFVMDADGSNMVRLTSAKKPNGRMANNEDPSFSPCGRFVMFTSDRSGKNQIYISNLDGSEERRITVDSANYFKPKWSNNFK